MKHLLWALAAIAITYWQVHAGIARCGTVDGGVLLAPMLIALAYLIHGVRQDLKKCFAGQALYLDQRRINRHGNHH